MNETAAKSENATNSEKISNKYSWKEILFLSLAGTILIFDGYLWKQLLVDDVSSGPVSYALPIALMVAFAIVWSIFAIVGSKKWPVWVFIFIASLGAVSFVSPIAKEYGLSPISAGWAMTILAAALLALALLYSAYTIHSSYENSVALHASKIISGGLSSLFTGLIILICFYYLHAQILRPPNLLPESLINRVVSLTSGIVDQQTEGQIQNIEDQIEPNPRSGNMSPEGLPPKLLERIRSNILNIFRGDKGEGPSEGAGSIDTSNVAEGIINTIRTQLDNLIEPYRPFIPYVFTLIFFFSVKWFTFALNWITIPLISLTMKTLARIGIIQKRKVQIEVERMFL